MIYLHFVSWNSLNSISPLFDDIWEWSELHTTTSPFLYTVCPKKNYNRTFRINNFKSLK